MQLDLANIRFQADGLSIPDIGVEILDDAFERPAGNQQQLALVLKIAASVRRSSDIRTAVDFLRWTCSKRSLLRRIATIAFTRALLQDAPSLGEELQKLVIFLMVTGVMDARDGIESPAQIFVHQLSGSMTLDAELGGTGYVSALLTQLTYFLVRYGAILPSGFLQILTLAELSGVRHPAPIPQEIGRTTDRSDLLGVSPAAMLRMGLRLHKDADTILREGLASDAMAIALLQATRQGTLLPKEAVRRAEAAYPEFKYIPSVVEIERTGHVPAALRKRVRRFDMPGTPTILEAGLDAELIGYLIDPATGEPSRIERDFLKEKPRDGHTRRRWNYEPTEIVTVDDATASPSGLVAFGDDRMLPLSFANQPNLSGSLVDRWALTGHRDLLMADDRVAVIRDFDTVDIEQAILLSGQANMNSYGHFILNGVAKLESLRHYVEAGETVIVPGTRKGFHDAILRYLDFNPESFRFTDLRLGFHSPMLRVVAEPPLGVWPYNLLKRMRDTLRPAQIPAGGRRIYLDRPESLRRGISNYNAVMEAVDAFGFERVVPETLPFEDQVRLLESADVIVSPHGSALVTLMFCLRPKRIVEISTKTGYRMCFYNFLGHEAVRVASKPVNESLEYVPDGVAYEVDVAHLKSGLAWAMAGR